MFFATLGMPGKKCNYFFLPDSQTLGKPKLIRIFQNKSYFEFIDNDGR
jgi:hypothetical protein